MSSRYKAMPQEACVADAVSSAFTELTDLAGECREIVDNASEGLAQTQRVQTLDETASALEGLSEPAEVSEKIGAARIRYTESTKKGGLSRAVRRDNAVAALQSVVDWCGERIEEIETELRAANEEEEAESNLENEKGELESLRDDAQEAIDAAEACEFPGMYG